MLKSLIKIAVGIALFSILLFAIGYQADKPIEELKLKYANAESRFMDLDGMEVHYRIEGEGQPIVLVHGTGASLHTWDEWTNLLKDSFQIIRMDIPAFGLTGPNPRGDYTPEYYVDFLHRFIEQLNIDSFCLVGNSLGGRIAWNYTYAYPGQVKKLILLDAAGVPHKGEMPMVFKLARNPFTAFLLKNILPKGFIEKNINEVYFDDVKITPELVDRYHNLALRTGNRQAFIDRANMKFADETYKLEKIDCPTLIMWGEHDQWVPLEDAHYFDKAIANSKLMVYENAGHVPMEEIAVETAKDVRFFLEN